MPLVGKKVLVTFNTKSWPIASATYTYEGHDEKGHWVRRADGTQRHLLYPDVVSVTVTEADVEETPH